MHSNTVNNKTSVLIASQIPQFVRDDHPQFVTFLEKYYEFLEQDGEQSYVTKNLTRYLDIDNISEDIIHDDEYDSARESKDYHVFLAKFHDNFLKFFPDKSAADRDMVVKHAKDIYRATGTEKSFRFIMRVLFDKESGVYYPKDDILRVSDGKWVVERSVRVNEISIANTIDQFGAVKFKSHLIRGETSNATAIVEDVDIFYDKGELISELKLSATKKDFQSGENIFTYIVEQGEEKRVTANIYSGILTAVTVTSPGEGYIEGEEIPVEPVETEYGLLGSGAKVVVNRTSKGGLLSIIPEKKGSGFAVGDDLLITGGSGFGAEANVSNIDASGKIMPNLYYFSANTVGQVANNLIAANSITGESVSYTGLITLWTNTSNITVNTGSGGQVTVINLSGSVANSNVYFETGDTINVNGVIAVVTYAPQDSNTIYVRSPGLPGNLVNKTLLVNKKPNVNTVMANSFTFNNFQCGPVTGIALLNGGAGYKELPTLSIKANSYMRSLGILGSMEIISGGLNYEIGDKILFQNPIFSYGTGARASVTNVAANGAITEVYYDTLDGLFPGGFGYNNTYLPTANIISANGSGANVIVTSLLGSGEKLLTITDKIGAIVDLRIVLGGSGYVVPPTINLAATGSGTAQAFSTIVTGIYTYPGRYINDDGQLSSYKFIQNKNYYQNYSYVTRINRPLNNYRQIIKDLIHPSGMILFGEYLQEDELGAGPLINSLSQVYNSEIYKSVSNTDLILYISSGAANSFNTTSNILTNQSNSSYNNAQLSNGAYIRGEIIWFDNSNDNLLIVNSTPELQSLQVPMTIAAWFNTSNSANIDTVFSQYSGTTSNNLVKMFRTFNNSIYYYTSNATGGIQVFNTPSGSIKSNTWTFGVIRTSGNITNPKVAITIGNRTYQYTANAFTITPNTNVPIMIGSDSIGEGPFGGAISDVWVYGRNLSNTEITNIYNATRERYGVDDVTVDGLYTYLDAANTLSWPNTGNTWYDISGYSHNFYREGIPSSIKFANTSQPYFIMNVSNTGYWYRSGFNMPVYQSTIEMWIQPKTSISGDYIWNYSVDEDERHNSLYDPNNLTMYGPYGGNLASGFAINQGGWYHVVKTSDRATGEEVLYVNGSIVDTAIIDPESNFIQGGTIIIGQKQNTATAYIDSNTGFQGNVSIVRVYDRHLTPYEVRTNFNAEKAKFGIFGI